MYRSAFVSRWIVEAAWVVMLIALASGLFAARYADPQRITTGDSYWYLRQAQVFAGTDPQTAAARASRLLCRDKNRSALKHTPRVMVEYIPADKMDAVLDMVKRCRQGYLGGRMPARYAAIFHSRPGYPLFAAPFVKLIGAWPGMIAATFTLGMAVALLAYAAVWLTFGLRLAGVSAAVLLYLLPSGFWITRMLPEGGVLAGYLAALVGATLVWRGRWIGLVLVSAALSWTFAAKPANGAALAIALLVASLAALVTPTRHRRDAFLTAALGLAALTAWFALSRILGLPSLNETIQDYATGHFSVPDIPDPEIWLVQKNFDFWPDRTGAALISPLPLAAVAFAAVVLTMKMRSIGLLWLAVGLSGLLVLAAHPQASQANRLITPVWLPVAAAVGYAVCAALSRPVRFEDVSPGAFSRQDLGEPTLEMARPVPNRRPGLDHPPGSSPAPTRVPGDYRRRGATVDEPL